MPNTKNEKNFESELMNFDGDRYDVVVLASIWAKELKKKSEYKNQPNAAVIKVALDDILSGRMSKDAVAGNQPPKPGSRTARPGRSPQGSRTQSQRADEAVMYERRRARTGPAV